MSLKSRLRERLAYLDQGTRDKVIADALDELDRPTLEMVDEGKRYMRDRDLRLDAGRGHGPTPPADSEFVEAVFARMVDAGRRGA